MNQLMQDLRYALRMLAKSPGFTAVAVLTLALGIGANSAIFSLTDQVLLRRLPVPHAEQLVELRAPGPDPGSTWSDGIQGSSFSYPMYKDLRERTTNAFSGLLATYPVALDISGQGASQRGAGELVSGNYFHVLGVTPALGRMFSLDDETVGGGNPVAVLSYGYWTRRFGRDPGVLNKTLVVNGTSLTVVGVAREGYGGIQIGAVPDLYIPITMKGTIAANQGTLAALDDRTNHWVQILGRLRAGTTSARAEAAIAPAYHALLESELPVVKPSQAGKPKFLAKKLLLDSAAQGRPILQQDAQGPLTTLLAMVGLVLLIACTNLASLLAARGESRQREIAVRLALGARRGRLIRQLLTESFLLAFAGGALGLMVASWALSLLVGSLAQGIQVLGLRAQLDIRVLAFAGVATIFTAVLFGLLPSLRATRVDLQSTLKEQGTSSTAASGSMRLRKVLIASQIALTVVLLAGSALFVESLMQLANARLGVKTDHVLQFSLNPQLDGYKPEQTLALFDRLRESIQANPGVRAVALAVIPIFQGDDSSSNLTFEGYETKPEENTNCMTNWISPHYFSTMGIPLLVGREFTEADASASPKVAIINEKLAKRFFAGRSPVGLRIAFGSGTNVHPNIEVVGVVADSKHDDVRDKISPFVYLPYAQFSHLGSGSFYVRTQQDPTSIAPELRQLIASRDARMPVLHVKTLAEQVDESMFADRMVTFLSLCLGLLAALLAAIGLYGVMAYVVARRTHEIGIRMALGAQRGDVLRMVLWQGAQLAVVGIAIGIAAGLGLAQFVATLLYGVSAHNPLAFIGVAVLLMLLALGSCYLPARRAMRVDPIVALRYE
ncbi:MAG TPA: ABC transporter permease [Candidatus Acidoferrales bacterium]|nr:ABC transporter permease [Candidatus Acidoferrales bacterium]